MRPWQVHEVKFGKMVRFRAGDPEWRSVIERVEPTFHVHLKGNPTVKFTLGEAMDLLEWFDPETREWKRCGIVEDYDK